MKNQEELEKEIERLRRKLYQRHMKFLKQLREDAKNNIIRIYDYIDHE